MWYYLVLLTSGTVLEYSKHRASLIIHRWHGFCQAIRVPKINEKTLELSRIIVYIKNKKIFFLAQARIPRAYMAQTRGGRNG